MSTVSENTIQSNMQEVCNEILELQHVRFAGLISNSGNLYAGGFKRKVIPMITDEKRQMMYMRFALEASFRNDFDDVFGTFRCSTIQREKISIITINVCDYVLLVFTEPRINLQNKIKEIQRIVESCKQKSESKAWQDSNS